MRVALEAPGILVVDEVLPPDAFAALSADVSHADYRSVHSRRWDRAWRLWDGSPLRGASVWFDPEGRRPGESPHYPTGTAVDRLFESIRELAGAHPGIAGSEGSDWVAMFLAPWLYPVGSALSLHHDAGTYSGAFTFFTHARWRIHWGGELMVFDAAPAEPQSARVSEEDEPEPPSGIATCVFPRPNRLALLGPDRPHMIRRVDTNAGAHVRASLAGFFLRPEP
ncbi:MAG: hypothetical protein M3340_14200 [Actinomycetota bacterium]|nr:hypothetical protein [Actinomycetota bacterium]